MRLQRPSATTGSSVGVEITSEMVKAAELAKTRHGLALRRYAEAPLPQGTVIDGEVKDSGVVGAALRQLWVEQGFTARKVVLSISSQRVIVRQATVPTMSVAEFTSALEFQAGDLIPLPVEHSVLDFTILPDDGGTHQPGSMQVLLGAAHRGVVTSQLAALAEASLKPVAVDASPLSAIRAAGPAIDDRALAVVQRSENLTVMAVRQAGALRFSRILSGDVADGGGRHVGRPDTEQSQPFGVPPAFGTNGSARTGLLVDEPAVALVASDIDPAVDEIVGSLSYFASQLPSGRLDQVIYAGDLAPAAGDELAGRLGCRVRALDVLCLCDVSSLDEGAQAAAASRGLLVLGAAQWPFDVAERRLSLVPRELGASGVRRRRLALTAAGVAVLALILGAATYHERQDATRSRQQAAAITAVSTRLQAQVAALSQLSQDEAAITGRLDTLRSTEADDIAWPVLLSEIAAAMPPQASLTNLAFASDTASPSGTASTASATSTSGSLGTLTLTAQATGNQGQVAAWLRALRDVKGLSDVWVSSSSASGDTVTFSSTATVDDAAPMVPRPDAENQP